MELKEMEDQTLKRIIFSLIDSEAVRFDIEHDTSGPKVFGPDGKRFLRLTSTRELLTDEIRDRILENWQEALVTLSQSLQDRLDLSNVTGLSIWQSDYGFDPHTLSFREDHNIMGSYRC